jgi:hypothetical protein
LSFSGDGSIDEEEFKSLCVSYGLNAQDSAEAYNKFTSVCTDSLINIVTVTNRHIYITTHVNIHYKHPEVSQNDDLGCGISHKNTKHADKYNSKIIFIRFHLK